MTVDWYRASMERERVRLERAMRLDGVPTELRPQVGGLVEFTTLGPGVVCAICLSGYCPAHGTGVADVYCHGELVSVHRIAGAWRCEGCGGVHPQVVG